MSIRSNWLIVAMLVLALGIPAIAQSTTRPRAEPIAPLEIHPHMLLNIDDEEFDQLVGALGFLSNDEYMPIYQKCQTVMLARARLIVPAGPDSIPSAPPVRTQAEIDALIPVIDITPQPPPYSLTKMMVDGRKQMAEYTAAQLMAIALRDLQAALNDPVASPDVIHSKLMVYRAARAKAEADLRAAQEDLRSILTQREEAICVEFGMLD